MSRLKGDAKLQPERLEEFKDRYDEIANQKQINTFSQNDHREYKTT